MIVRFFFEFYYKEFVRFFFVADSSLSEHLQFVKATILSNAECQLIYGNQISENMACVEGNYNEGTCTVCIYFLITEI